MVRPINFRIVARFSTVLSKENAGAIRELHYYKNEQLRRGIWRGCSFFFVHGGMRDSRSYPTYVRLISLLRGEKNKAGR